MALKSLNSDERIFTQDNLINVSTQNNFCAYYVLARRIINDNNLANLLNNFNQFYQTNWNNDQLGDVLANMHPAQAEIVLGLVLQEQDSENRGKQGLELYEFDALCEKFGYCLSVFQQKYFPGNLKESSFTSLREYLPNDKEILVFFHLPSDTSELGHYCLVEPDEVAASARDRYQHRYEINNIGSNTEMFINNIKLSVKNIDAQINSSSPPIVTESFAAETKSIQLDKKNQIKEDKYFAWECALKDVRSLTCKNLTEIQLNSFNKYLFFKINPLQTNELLKDFDQTAAKEAKKYICDLQSKEIDAYNSTLCK